MRIVANLKALSGIDIKNVRRDSTLPWLAGFPIVLALALRWGIPPLETILQQRYEFDLVPYHPLILSFIALAMPIRRRRRWVPPKPGITPSLTSGCPKRALVLA